MKRQDLINHLESRRGPVAVAEPPKPKRKRKKKKTEPTEVVADGSDEGTEPAEEEGE